MSSRKGDNKKKGQKYQNRIAFKNNLHDTSKTTKVINSIVVQGVCKRCREIIEWRKKYSKYKPLTAPKKCVKCKQKTVKHAYHTICVNCAVEHEVCEKCGCKKSEIERSKHREDEQTTKDGILPAEVKHFSERQRRSFFRALEQGAITKDSHVSPLNCTTVHCVNQSKEDICSEATSLTRLLSLADNSSDTE